MKTLTVRELTLLPSSFCSAFSQTPRPHDPELTTLLCSSRRVAFDFVSVQKEPQQDMHRFLHRRVWIMNSIGWLWGVILTSGMLRIGALGPYRGLLCTISDTSFNRLLPWVVSPSILAIIS